MCLARDNTENNLTQNDNDGALNSERTMKYEEMEIEDKAWSITTVGDTCKVWVVHQAASRQLRRDIATQMRKNIKEMDIVESDEFNEKIEMEANEIENNLFRVINEKRAIITASAVNASASGHVNQSAYSSIGGTANVSSTQLTIGAGALVPLTGEANKVPIFDFEIN